MRLFACRQFTPLAQKSLLKTLLIMNLTTVFLLALCLSASAKTFSQRVSLSEKNVPLEKIFKEITRQTGYTFVYTRSLLKKSKNISINVRNAPIERSLDLCFKEQPLTYTILKTMVVIKEKEIVVPKEIIYTQTPTAILPPPITGKVTDNKGLPLEGATILVKGTSAGVKSDANGNFSIEAAPNSTLVISYVGFESTEVNVENRTNISVQLRPSVATGDEVVVVGYGTKKRGEITGSISNIGSDAIVEHRNTDLVKSLQGAAPGLIVKDVGGIPGSEDATILIRGTHTLGDNSPLYVVDGVPQPSISQISPYDIEQISVLKDASAAIYGARAANGVILIKTKRGRSGKVNLNLNAELGSSKLTREPAIQNSYQYAIYRNEAFKAVGLPPQFSDDDIELYRNQTDPLTHPSTDWYHLTYKKYAPVSSYNVSASGGSENVQFYLSGSYLDQSTNYASNDGRFRRYQLRSNIDAHIGKYLKLGADLSLRLRNSKMPIVDALGVMHGVWFAYPTEVGQFPNGLYGAVHEDRNTMVISSFLPGYNNQENGFVNPRLSFELNMDWITRGLKLIGYSAFNYRLNNSKTFQHPITVYNYNESTDEYIGRPTLFPAGGHITLNQSTSFYKEELYHLRLAYERRFGNHGVSGFIAAESDQSVTNAMNAGRKDLFSDNKDQLFAGAEDGRTVGGSSVLSGRENYFGSVSYDFKRRYMLDFTLRSDGSFNFPKGQQFGTFPSISAAWNIYKESFMSNDKIDNLKLRASYGEMGNDRIPDYQFLTRYNVNSFMIFGQEPTYNSGITIANIPNPNITWETSKMMDVGVDVTFFNKLNITLDYFYEKRRGILIQRSLSVPLYTAITLPYENLGKVDNWGFESQIGYSNKIGNFNYSVNGNFTYNRDKVIYMDEPKNIPSYQKQEGHPINSMLAYVADGLFKSKDDVDNSPHIPGAVPGFIKYVDLNGDGKISSLDQKRFYQSTTPAIQFGLNATLSYKGLSLFFMLQGQGDALNAIGFNDDGAKPEIYFTERWTEDNPNAKQPRPTLGFSQYYLTSSYDFQSAAYLRLKNLQISYDLSSIKGVSNIFKACNVYLRGTNVWTLSQIKLFDPELPYVADQRGNRARYYPQLSRYSIGFNITL